MGHVVYVYNTKHSPPPGGSCSAGAPVGPYVSIECEPLNPQPMGASLKLGTIETPELGSTSTVGLTDVSFYVESRDAVLEIYAAPSAVHSIESSVSTSQGHC